MLDTQKTIRFAIQLIFNWTPNFEESILLLLPTPKLCYKDIWLVNSDIWFAIDRLLSRIAQSTYSCWPMIMAWLKSVLYREVFWCFVCGVCIDQIPDREGKTKGKGGRICLTITCTVPLGECFRLVKQRLNCLGEICSNSSGVKRAAYQHRHYPHGEIWWKVAWSFGPHCLNSLRWEMNSEVYIGVLQKKSQFSSPLTEAQ